MTNLTARRHRQTRAEIADAAIRLFTVHGYDDVTMEQVAEAAGVSRRTAYRHFPNKYELVFDHPDRWLERFRTVVADRRVDESTRDICRRGIMSVAALIQETADDVLAAWAVYVSNDALVGKSARARDAWRATYAELLAADVDDTPETELAIATIAGSLVAMTDALCAIWAARQPDADMVALTADALEVIEPLWPIPSR